jgi:hypothetical protein
MGNMVLENVMMETYLVENFAVCCTENLTMEVGHDRRVSQAVNRFFAKVSQREQEEAAIPLLTLVHNLETRLWGPTKELRSDDRTRYCEARLLAQTFFASSNYYSR